MGVRTTQGNERRLLFSNYSAWKHRPPLCHLDRSAAQWRDLRFFRPVLTPSHTGVTSGRVLPVKKTSQHRYENPRASILTGNAFGSGPFSADPLSSDRHFPDDAPSEAQSYPCYIRS